MLPRAILDASIGVKYQPMLNAPNRHGHLKCVNNQLIGHRGIQCPTDYLSREQIHDDRQIDETSLNLDVGDVRHPFLLGLLALKLRASKVSLTWLHA